VGRARNAAGASCTPYRAVGCERECLDLGLRCKTKRGVLERRPGGAVLTRVRTWRSAATSWPLTPLQHCTCRISALCIGMQMVHHVQLSLFKRETRCCACCPSQQSAGALRHCDISCCPPRTPAAHSMRGYPTLDAFIASIVVNPFDLSQRLNRCGRACRRLPRGCCAGARPLSAACSLCLCTRDCGRLELRSADSTAARLPLAVPCNRRHVRHR
jgi:hypothetical protein